jgi:cell division protein FtsA
MIAAGVVLTGGTALMEGMQDAAEKYLGTMQIRRGVPRNIGGLTDVVNSPVYATGVGLVLFGAENFQPAPGRFRPAGMLNRLWKTISEYL